MFTTQTIAVINGQQIQVSDDEQKLVPIKPICDAMGIDRKGQQVKIKEHPILSSVGELWPLTGSDGKTYEMFCLPLKYVYGWLFSINPNNVNEEAREKLIKYQEECYNALYDYFTRDAERIAEQNKQELAALEELKKLYEEKANVNQRIKNAEKELDSIRVSRLDKHPKLF